MRFLAYGDYVLEEDHVPLKLTLCLNALAQMINWFGIVPNCQAIFATFWPGKGIVNFDYGFSIGGIDIAVSSTIKAYEPSANICRGAQRCTKPYCYMAVWRDYTSYDVTYNGPLGISISLAHEPTTLPVCNANDPPLIIKPVRPGKTLEAYFPNWKIYATPAISVGKDKQSISEINYAFMTISYSNETKSWYVDTTDAYGDFAKCVGFDACDNFESRCTMVDPSLMCSPGVIALAPYFGAKTASGNCPVTVNVDPALDQCFGVTKYIAQGTVQNKIGCQTSLSAASRVLKKGVDGQYYFCGTVNYLMKQANLPDTTRLKMSIGGWSDSNFFSPATRPENIDAFTTSIASWVSALGWDGVDIDWELPMAEHRGQPVPTYLGGTSNIKPGDVDTVDTCKLATDCQYDRTKDVQQYVQLLKLFRAKMNNLTTSISIAAPAGYGDIANIAPVLSTMCGYLDHLNLMAYDFHGAWETAPLYDYTPPSLPSSTGGPSIDESINRYIAAGCPANKIVMGIPWYSRTVHGVQVAEDLYDHSVTGSQENVLYPGLYQPFDKLQTTAPELFPNFRDIDATDPTSHDAWVEYWDPYSQCNWYLRASTKSFASVDSVRTVINKARYVNRRRLAGTMAWMMGQDSADMKLLNAMRDTMDSNSTSTEPRLDAPAYWTGWPPVPPDPVFDYPVVLPSGSSVISQYRLPGIVGGWSDPGAAQLSCAVGTSSLLGSGAVDANTNGIYTIGYGQISTNGVSMPYSRRLVEVRTVPSLQILSATATFDTVVVGFSALARAAQPAAANLAIHNWDFTSPAMSVNSFTIRAVQNGQAAPTNPYSLTGVAVKDTEPVLGFPISWTLSITNASPALKLTVSFSSPVCGKTDTGTAATDPATSPLAPGSFTVNLVRGVAANTVSACQAGGPTVPVSAVANKNNGVDWALSVTLADSAYSDGDRLVDIVATKVKLQTLPFAPDSSTSTRTTSSTTFSSTITNNLVTPPTTIPIIITMPVFPPPPGFVALPWPPFPPPPSQTTDIETIITSVTPALTTTLHVTYTPLQTVAIAVTSTASSTAGPSTTATSPAYPVNPASTVPNSAPVPPITTTAAVIPATTVVMTKPFTSSIGSTAASPFASTRTQSGSAVISPTLSAPAATPGLSSSGWSISTSATSVVSVGISSAGATPSALLTSTRNPVNLGTSSPLVATPSLNSGVIVSTASNQTSSSAMMASSPLSTVTTSSPVSVTASTTPFLSSVASAQVNGTATSRMTGSFSALSTVGAPTATSVAAIQNSTSTKTALPVSTVGTIVSGITSATMAQSSSAVGNATVAMSTTIAAIRSSTLTNVTVTSRPTGASVSSVSTVSNTTGAINATMGFGQNVTSTAAASSSALLTGTVPTTVTAVSNTTAAINATKSFGQNVTSAAPASSRPQLTGTVLTTRPTGSSSSSVSSSLSPSMTITSSTTAAASATLAPCAICTGTIVADWCGLSVVPRTNSLNGVLSDEGTMAMQAIAFPGVLQLTAVSTVASYWYTDFTPGACMTAGTANALQITVSAPAGSTFQIAIRYRTDAACTVAGPVLAVDSSSYATFDGSRKTLVIPFTDFQGLDGTKLHSLSDDATMKQQALASPGILQLTALSAASYWYTILGTGACMSAGTVNAIQLVVSAPVGSTFQIAVRFKTDAACTVAGPVLTVNAATYAKFDGITPATLLIPFTDLQGIDATRLQSIALQQFSVPLVPYNFSCIALTYVAPASVTPTAVCVTCKGTVVANWCGLTAVPGTNLLNGLSSDDMTMKQQALASPGILQLTALSAASYWYTILGTGGCMAAGTANAIQLVVSAPVGSTFQIAVRFKTDAACSVAGPVLTVNAATYAKFNGITPATLLIPFTDLPGIDATKLQSISLQQFSVASVPYNLSCIALTYVAPPPVAPCITCTGTRVANWCGLTAVPATNSLGGLTSDDRTMLSQIATWGVLQLTPSDLTSYWYTVFGTGACMSAGTTNAFQITLSAPTGSTFQIAVRFKTDTACTTSGPVLTVDSNSYATFDGSTPKTLVIPFADFPGLDATKLQSLSFQKFSAAKQAYNVSCLSLSNVCIKCAGTVIASWCGATGVPNTNSLGGASSDDNSMSLQGVGASGTLMLTPLDATSYWYSIFGSAPCYSAGTATGVQITVSAPAGSTFQIVLRYRTDAACTVFGPALSVNSAAYATFDGSTKTLLIPFSDFKGVDPTRLQSIAFQAFSAPKQVYSFSCVSLTTVTTTAAPACTACPTPSLLDYCTKPVANINMLGGVSSDETTMASPPAVVGGAILLIPLAGSYWYTNLACVDVSKYKSLVLNVKMPAGASFTVELQTAAAATGCPVGGGNTRADVLSTAYTVSTGTGSQTLTIPLAAFQAATAGVDLIRVTALAFVKFSTASVTYQIACAFWSM
ncbi:hypothetical protein HDU88_008310 [Geranomyces variabilis]|nr:hypothetical protein HDU88_008310 [Geranomyces variabilis]